ncbi:MAG: DUF1003 domain-containing protein [Bacteriovoracales bacterium]
MAKKITCAICKNYKNFNEIMSGTMLSQNTSDFITTQNPEWTDESFICHSCLNNLRALQVEQLIEEEKGKLSRLEKQVFKSMREQEILSENYLEEYEEQLTFGQRVADRIAQIGGSWPFIISFLTFLVIWIGLNTSFLTKKPFDPFPYILLNLMLSCLAALQAPIIMMSQGRQSVKDRLKAEMDYQVNLKAELQTRGLNRKMDQFMTQQWQRLIEIQQLQTQIMGSKSTTQPEGQP